MLMEKTILGWRPSTTPTKDVRSLYDALVRFNYKGPLRRAFILPDYCTFILSIVCPVRFDYKGCKEEQICCIWGPSPFCSIKAYITTIIWNIVIPYPYLQMIALRRQTFQTRTPERCTLSTSPESDCVVSPRVGTISSWSTKATEIALTCSIPILRIERTVLLKLNIQDPVLMEKLFDPMTESLLQEQNQLDTLFGQGAPKKDPVLPFSENPYAHLQRLNVEYGLALNEDEIHYLIDSYNILGRAPHWPNCPCLPKQTQNTAPQNLQSSLDYR